MDWNSLDLQFCEKLQNKLPEVAQHLRIGQENLDIILKFIKSISDTISRYGSDLSSLAKDVDGKGRHKYETSSLGKAQRYLRQFHAKHGDFFALFGQELFKNISTLESLAKKHEGTRSLQYETLISKDLKRVYEDNFRIFTDLQNELSKYHNEEKRMYAELNKLKSERFGSIVKLIAQLKLCEDSTEKTNRINERIEEQRSKLVSSTTGLSQDSVSNIKKQMESQFDRSNSIISVIQSIVSKQTSLTKDAFEKSGAYYHGVKRIDSVSDLTEVLGSSSESSKPPSDSSLGNYFSNFKQYQENLAQFLSYFEELALIETRFLQGLENDSKIGDLIDCPSSTLMSGQDSFRAAHNAQRNSHESILQKLKYKITDLKCLNSLFSQYDLSLHKMADEGSLSLDRGSLIIPSYSDKSLSFDQSNALKSKARSSSSAQKLKAQGSKTWTEFDDTFFDALDDGEKDDSRLDDDDGGDGRSSKQTAKSNTVYNRKTTGKMRMASLNETIDKKALQSSSNISLKIFRTYHYLFLGRIQQLGDIFASTINVYIDSINDFGEVLYGIKFQINQMDALSDVMEFVSATSSGSECPKNTEGNLYTYDFCAKYQFRDLMSKKMSYKAKKDNDGVAAGDAKKKNEQNSEENAEKETSASSPEQDVKKEKLMKRFMGKDDNPEAAKGAGADGVSALSFMAAGSDEEVEEGSRSFNVSLIRDQKPKYQVEFDSESESKSIDLYSQYGELVKKYEISEFPVVSLQKTVVDKNATETIVPLSLQSRDNVATLFYFHGDANLRQDVANEIKRMYSKINYSRNLDPDLLEYSILITRKKAKPVQAKLYLRFSSRTLRINKSININLNVETIRIDNFLCSPEINLWCKKLGNDPCKITFDNFEQRDVIVSQIWIIRFRVWEELNKRVEEGIHREMKAKPLAMQIGSQNVNDLSAEKCGDISEQLPTNDDIYVCGLQNVRPSRSNWPEVFLQKLKTAYPKRRYKVIIRNTPTKSINRLLFVIARLDVPNMIRNYSNPVASDKNGNLQCNFMVDDSSFAFLMPDMKVSGNSASKSVSELNDKYYEIAQKMKLEAIHYDALEQIEHFYVLGDLRYPIGSMIKRPTALKLLDEEKFPELFEHDTLSEQIECERAFGRFKEGPIGEFLPSYPLCGPKKYGGKGTKSQLVPSQADRILYKSLPGCDLNATLLEAVICNEISDRSDHCPVFTEFEIRARPPCFRINQRALEHVRSLKKNPKASSFVDIKFHNLTIKLTQKPSSPYLASQSSPSSSVSNEQIRRAICFRHLQSENAVVTGFANQNKKNDNQKQSDKVNYGKICIYSSDVVQLKRSAVFVSIGDYLVGPDTFVEFGYSSVGLNPVFVDGKQKTFEFEEPIYKFGVLIGRLSGKISASVVSRPTKMKLKK